MRTIFCKSMRALIVIFAAFSIVSCSSAVNLSIKYHPIEPSPGSRSIPGNIVLQLTREFENYKFRWAMSTPTEYPIGKPLSQYAEAVTGALFRDLTVVHGNVVPTETVATFVLVPKVCGISVPIRYAALQERTVKVSIEWSLRNRTGDVLWIKTIDGEATGNMGYGFGPGSVENNVARDLNIALETAFHNSYNKINSAEELRTIMQSSR